MKTIKAIETEYNGYRFRSRLEARWAVLFDSASIKYEYEPEGFELSDGTRYLPDFYLPDYDWYVEVKPPRENAIEDIKRALQFVGDKIKVLLLLGNIPPKTDIDAYHYSAMYYNTLRKEIYIESVFLDVGFVPSLCDIDLNKITLEFQTLLYVDRARNKFLNDRVLYAIHDRDMYKDVYKDMEKDIPVYCDFVYDEREIDFLNSCYEKARQARFEHGEKPRV